MGTMVRFPILERAHIPMKAKNHVWNQLTFSEVITKPKKMYLKEV